MWTSKIGSVSDWFAFKLKRNNGKTARCESFNLYSNPFGRGECNESIGVTVYIQAFSENGEIERENVELLSRITCVRTGSQFALLWSTIHSECLMATNVPFRIIVIGMAFECSDHGAKKRNRISAPTKIKITFRPKMPNTTRGSTFFDRTLIRYLRPSIFLFLLPFHWILEPGFGMNHCKWQHTHKKGGIKIAPEFRLQMARKRFAKIKPLQLKRVPFTLFAYATCSAMLCGCVALSVLLFDIVITTRMLLRKLFCSTQAKSTRIGCFCTQVSGRYDGNTYTLSRHDVRAKTMGKQNQQVQVRIPSIGSFERVMRNSMTSRDLPKPSAHMKW